MRYNSEFICFPQNHMKEKKKSNQNPHINTKLCDKALYYYRSNILCTDNQNSLSTFEGNNFQVNRTKNPQTNKNKNKTKKKVRTTFCHKMVQNLIKNNNEGKGY